MKIINKMLQTSILLLLMLSLILGGGLTAYGQTNIDPEHSAFERLQQLGILSKDSNKKIKPTHTMTTASAITLLVRAYDLNLNHIKFVKAPKASDYFTHVKDDMWYSKSFITAHLNGIEIPKNIDPTAAITKEQFSHLLYQSLILREDYVWIEPYLLIHDEKSISKTYMGSIQKLLITDIAQLDKNQKYHPQQLLTYGSTALLLDRALQFRDQQHQIEPDPSGTLNDLSITSEVMMKDVRLVTVSATAPHSGYGIEITHIRFEGKQAHISYRLIPPNPKMMYPQVISTIEATTYIAADYEPVLDNKQDTPEIKPKLAH